MRRKRLEQEIQRVVKRVLPLFPTDREMVKADFETILGEIMA